MKKWLETLTGRRSSGKETLLGAMTKDRVVGVYISDTRIDFDLRNSHERQYLLHYLFGTKIPQIDIDCLLFQHLLRKGDRVLDCGANIGVTALEILEAGASQVVAVEPVRSIYKRLKKLEGSRLKALNLAVSDVAGSVDITISETHNQGSSFDGETVEMFRDVYGKSPKTEKVKTTTIDLLVDEFGYFDVWKLDVEGAEVAALRGSERSLSTKLPRIIIVESYGQKAQAV